MDKRKKLLFVVWLVVFILGINAYAQESSKVLKRYQSTKKDFSIAFPKDWEIENDVQGTLIMGASPVENSKDIWQENINVVREELPEKIDLAEYTKLNLANFKKLMTDFKIYDKGKTAIGDADAQYIICSYRMGDVRLKVLIYILVKNSRGYAIICTASPETFNKYKKQFEEIAATVKFK